MSQKSSHTNFHTILVLRRDLSCVLVDVSEIPNNVNPVGNVTEVHRRTTTISTSAQSLVLNTRHCAGHQLKREFTTEANSTLAEATHGFHDQIGTIRSSLAEMARSKKLLLNLPVTWAANKSYGGNSPRFRAGCCAVAAHTTSSATPTQSFPRTTRSTQESDAHTAPTRHSP